MEMRTNADSCPHLSAFTCRLKSYPLKWSAPEGRRSRKAKLSQGPRSKFLSGGGGGEAKLDEIFFGGGDA